LKKTTDESEVTRWYAI